MRKLGEILLWTVRGSPAEEFEWLQWMSQGTLCSQLDTLFRDEFEGEPIVDLRSGVYFLFLTCQTGLLTFTDIIPLRFMSLRFASGEHLKY